MELIEFLISMFFATLICGGIICIFMYLFYSRAGYKVLRFRIYCWEYCINPDGNSAKKYIIRKNAFKLAPDLSMYKPDADIDQELDLRLTCLSIMCMGAITVLFDLVCVYMAIQRGGFFIDSFPVMFMYTLSGTMTLYLISLIVIIISGKYGKKNELGNYLNHNIHQMMATGRITEPLLPPLESLGLKGNIHTCLQYQLVRFRQMQIIGDYAEINKIADYLENEMPDNYPNPGIHQSLVFYYCYFRQSDPAAYTLAVSHFSKCRVELEKGLDSNDKRIYAYYKYYIEHDPRAAWQLAQEELAMLPSNTLLNREEKTVEEKWLTHLLNMISSGTYR